MVSAERLTIYGDACSPRRQVDLHTIHNGANLAAYKKRKKQKSRIDLKYRSGFMESGRRDWTRTNDPHHVKV
ncbi:MAG: hypothetical protein RKO68_14735, partial [Candidatus Accumulibacter sp.]|nr:hypothetical protein [Accumulibacter sp.]